MVVTPEIAKLKWCPMGRQGHISGVSMNDPQSIRGWQSPIEPEYACHCIGEDCMMWRAVREGVAPYKDHRGFCGLAGKPEL